ncbi:iron ABC transporter permease [Cereibacter sphaeroides]|uniref:iron ABC transporter permease n=1 Tax=Cereibacter sphaeroides TaxID=1063 RepID=UPI001F423AB6|nr:iron ABC transporter permease [Cereibacter sphaeroides]MCE6951498.1 iron ABC transporter permease [Cereibacter sphaeroides]
MTRMAVLLAAVLGAAMLSLFWGPEMGFLWRGLWSGEGPAALTLRVIRGPRVAAGLGVGAVLGLSGALFQMLFRNPLAAPDLMGFTSGAGLAIVAAISLGLALPLPLVSAAGGLLAALLVAALSRHRHRPTPPLTLVLVGLGVGFTTSALGTFLMTRLPVQEAAEAQRWLTGSLAARGWDHVAQVWAIGIGLTLAAAAQMRPLAALELGPDLAAGLGIRAGRARAALAATAVLLAAAGVAVAGPLPFVALMAAPLGARLVQARTAAGRLAAAATTGAGIVVLADLAARAALPGIQLPVGVATGLLGAPYLLWLLAREMERGDL